MSGSDTTTSNVEERPRAIRTGRSPEVLALVVLWCAHEPEHVGEVLLPLEGDPAPPCVFGRGDGDDDPGTIRVRLVRQRPGTNADAGPLEARALSRQQLVLAAEGGRLRIENVGRPGLIVRGQPIDFTTIAPGDIVEVDSQILFLCVSRPIVMADAPNWDTTRSPSFGEADELGAVGESTVAWNLRAQVAMLAQRHAHVLVTGESGTGKELVAHALHSLSSRATKRLVARNAATFPSGLIDAELFGNVANYPNAGSPDRPGLLGEADGSTLFLDEIGELSEEMQTHLLRAADSEGDYQRLGESRRRKVSFRLVGATNRPLDRLKSDLLARIPLRLALVGLNERREDIPLLARHLLRRIASRDAAIGARFFDRWNGRTGEPRITCALVRALVMHTYTTHVRELEALLWRALTTSPNHEIDLTDDVRRELGEPVEETLPKRDVREVSAEELRAAMERHGGVQEKVWRELGLPNRYVLKRLLKRHGLRA